MQNGNPDMVIMLIGNKADMEARCVLKLPRPTVISTSPADPIWEASIQCAMQCTLHSIHDFIFSVNNHVILPPLLLPLQETSFHGGGREVCVGPRADLSGDVRQDGEQRGGGLCAHRRQDLRQHLQGGFNQDFVALICHPSHSHPAHPST